MFTITASSRFVNLRNSFKIYYVMALGVLISVLIFVAYRDVLGMLTMLTCTGALYFILWQKPAPVEITISEEKMTIGEEKINWAKCIGWAMLELGEKLEFVIHTSQFGQNFHYFYLEKDEVGLRDLIINLNQFVPYDEEIPSRDWLHKLFRRFGLK